MKVLNPANGELVADVYEDTPATVDDKYAAARRAQPGWEARPLAERLGAIRAFRELVSERRERLAETLTAETGKPIAQSHNELDGLLPRLDFFCDKAEETLRPETVYASDEMEEVIEHEPLGVIANISAWNYPYFVGSNVFVPALIAGNSVLYKPSEHATLTGIAIAEMLHAAGVTKDAFVLVLGGPEIGSALLQHEVEGVFFTGSYRTGKAIAEEVASRLTRVQLELGGKDPVYVADDVDVDVAAQALAGGAFYNCGQSCCAVERIYVHRAIADRFTEAFVEVVEGFVVGDPTSEQTYIGPVARSAQIPVLEAQVSDAIDKGATLLTGGHRLRGPGNWFEPTVLGDCTHEMDVMRSETFGPVAGIQTVDDDEQALELMNDTDYGLTAGVYTRVRERAERMLRRVDTGSVYWNCCDRVSPRLPWSGRGHSGIGCTLSTYGILTFAQPKAWHLRRS